MQKLNRRITEEARIVRWLGHTNVSKLLTVALTTPFLYYKYFFMYSIPQLQTYQLTLPWS